MSKTTTEPTTEGMSRLVKRMNESERLRKLSNGELVAAEPGIALKHAAGRIEHHWASDADARRRLTKLVQDLRVDGVEARMEAGLLTLWPVGGGQG